MNRKTLINLGAVVAALLLVWFVLDRGNNGAPASELLLPSLKAQINDVDMIVARRADATTTLAKGDVGWGVSERNGYPANVGTLRDLLIALGEAKVLEQKTSNPDRYAQLGVDDPDNEDSEAVELTIRGAGDDIVVLLGKVAQSSNRYARLGGNEQSVLIDKNPDVPSETGDWLASDLLDISSDRVQSIVISHADGEELRIEKSAEDATGFDVTNVPEGRELSYPAVANGIGGALSGLELDDVRPASDDLTAATVTEYRTFDGLVINISAYDIDDASWFGFDVAYNAPETEDTETEAESETETDESSDTEAVASEDAGESDGAGDENDSAGDEAEIDSAVQAETITDRTRGWLYKVPDFKANLFERRFEDILQAEDDDEE